MCKSTREVFIRKKSFKCEFAVKYNLDLLIASVHEGKNSYECKICDKSRGLVHLLGINLGH